MGTTLGRAIGGRKILLNSQLLNDELFNKGRAVNETIPHEVAHIVCQNFPHLGRRHDAGWKRVCLALGGDGKRCHAERVKRLRKTKKFIYEVDGNTFELGSCHHKRLQQGHYMSLVAKRNYEKYEILPSHFTGKYRIIQ